MTTANQPPTGKPKQQRRIMTNQELIDLANSKGYLVTLMNQSVYIGPSPMRPARLFSLEAVAEAMDLPEELFFDTGYSVSISGVDA